MNQAGISRGDIVFNTRNRRAYKISDTDDWQTTIRGEPGVRVHRWDNEAEHIRGRRTFAQCKYLVPFTPGLLNAAQIRKPRSKANANRVDVQVMA